MPTTVHAALIETLSRQFVLCISHPETLCRSDRPFGLVPHGQSKPCGEPVSRNRAPRTELPAARTLSPVDPPYGSCKCLFADAKRRGFNMEDIRKDHLLI
jgi:hypothetical protein